MTKLHYTLRQVIDLKPALTDMVKTIVSDVLTRTEENKSFTKMYKLVTDKETDSGELFKFVVAPNPVDDLLQKDRIRDKEAYRKRAMVTATVILGNRPWGIAFQQEDFDKPVEEVLSSENIGDITNQLLHQIVVTMAESWYRNGLRDRISLWNSESNFFEISDYFNDMIQVGWDEFGYKVDVLVPDPNGKDETSLFLYKRDISFSQVPNTNSIRGNQQISQGHLDAGIIALMTLGLVEKDFTWTIN